MKQILLCLGVCVWSWAFAAEPVAPTSDAPSTLTTTPSPEERRQERQRLDEKSQQIEAAYKEELLQCYQKFDVVSCRLQARDRRIDARAALRKEELPFKAMERRINTEEAKQRLLERQSEALQKKEEAERAQALAQAKKRAQSAQPQVDPALQGTKRGAYEQKLQDAAAHRAKVENKKRDKEPAAPLPVPHP